MNPLKLVLFALAAAAGSASAIPQGYGGSSGGSSSAPQRQQKNCEWRTVVEYEESTRQDCKTEYQRKCSTLYKEVCTPYQHEVCDPYQRQQCDEKQRTKYKTWNEEVCKDKYVNHCDKHWETDSYGAKHWVDNAATCKQVVDGKTCNQVERREPYSEAYTDCYSVPDKKCRYVTKQNCKQQPYQDCQRVPYQDCDTVHEKKPKQVRRRYCNGKPVNGGNNNNNGQHNDRGDYDDYDYDYSSGNGNGGSGSYTAQDVSNAFDVRSEDNLGTKEVVGTRSEGEDVDDGEKDESAITFGKK